jgi:hypothetical protein
MSPIASLDVRRRHVLAAGVDDQLLLAVDDLQVAVLVELTYVAGVQPALVVDRLTSLVRVVAVAARHDAAPDQHLAVFSELDLHARRHRAHRADLDPIGRVAGPVAGGLGHPPQLGQRHADRVEELDHLTRRGRGADVDRLDLVEPQQRPHLRQHELVGLRVLGAQVVGDGLAGLLELDLAQAHVERPERRPLALLVLLGLDAGLDGRLQLLPDARHGEEPGRPHLGQVGDHLARVRAVGGREAQHHRHVVRAGALGDVGHRQQ